MSKFNEEQKVTRLPFVPEMRIGRAEREVVVKILNEAYIADRISTPEHDERLEKALQATTQRELDGIVGDLVTAVHPAPNPPPILVKKEEKPPRPSTTKTVGKQTSARADFWKTVLFMGVITTFFLLVFYFLVSNNPQNFYRLQAHISEISILLAEESLRTNGVLTLTGEEGLGTVRTANGEPLSGVKSAEILKILDKDNGAYTAKWNVTSDGNLLTFTTNYGFILSREVKCTIDVNVPAGNLPPTTCTKRAI